MKISSMAVLLTDGYFSFYLIDFTLNATIVTKDIARTKRTTRIAAKSLPA